MRVRRKCHVYKDDIYFECCVDGHDFNLRRL